VPFEEAAPLRADSSVEQHFTQARCFALFVEQRCLLLQTSSWGWDLQESGNLPVWWTSTSPS